MLMYNNNAWTYPDTVRAVGIFISLVHSGHLLLFLR